MNADAGNIKSNFLYVPAQQYTVEIIFPDCKSGMDRNPYEIKRILQALHQ